MSSVICTLFEGHFHYGVAALVNSHYQHGFKGDFFIGYRGELPFWATAATNNNSLNWPGTKTLIIAEELKLHFLPINTNAHFTNYKTHFILELWEKCIDDSLVTGILYFDPDIVNKCSWKYYEQWITYGVALVHEIVWNDMPPSHPKRHQWATVASGLGYQIKNKLNSQINAGFIGVASDKLGFIQMWNNLITHAVQNFKFDMTKLAQHPDNNNLFSAGDQDLLNLTAMCTNEDLSEFGPEGMDFISGGWPMSHATGSPKPWKKNFIMSALNGKPPTLADKAYWKNVNGPVNCYKPIKIKFKRFCIVGAAFIGRFYARI